MEIPQIAPYSSYGGNRNYPASVKRLYQATKKKEIPAPKAYTVELSHAAQARSLKAQGFSAYLIALKLGLDVGTVNQYLGITETAETGIFKSTYVQPRAAYRESAVVTRARSQIATDLSQLPFARFTWSKTLSNLLPESGT